MLTVYLLNNFSENAASQPASMYNMHDWNFPTGR